MGVVHVILVHDKKSISELGSSHGDLKKSFSNTSTNLNSGKMSDVNPKHPRAESLRIREKIAKGFERGLVTPEGLSAHGRGEAFDYLLGEKTTKQAKRATKAAVAELLLADTPVFSVNGNTAALVPKEIVKLTERINAQVEVNLYHRSDERSKKIAEYLKKNGVEEVLGIEKEYSSKIPETRSHRRIVDERGIKSADVVLVPLEDGDRTEALKKLGKTVITIDLNPMSRTAKTADVTIVDNIVRVLPLMIKESDELSNTSSEKLKKIIHNFDNEQNLRSTLKNILANLKKVSKS